MGNTTQSAVGTLWNSSTAQALRRSILDETYNHCRALSCPYLAPGGPSLPRCEEVAPLLQRRVLSESLVVLPWGPEVVEVDLREQAQAGAIAESLIRSDLLQDATTVVFLMTPAALEDRRVAEALERLPIDTMLSLRIVVDFPVHAFTPVHWRRIKATLGAVHELQLGVAPEHPFEYDQDSGLQYARELRRTMKVPRLVLRCPLQLLELEGLDHLLTQRSAFHLDHIEIIPAAGTAASRPTGLDKSLHEKIRALANAPWRQDAAIALGPLHALFLATDIDASWQDWSLALGLDEAQQAIILALVNTLKETVAELFDGTPADGSPSPIAYLQALEQEVSEQSARQTSFEQYIAEKKTPAGTLSFHDARMLMEAECRKKIAALLDARQGDVFRSLGGHSLLNLETGFEPLQQKVHGSASQGIAFDVWATEQHLTPTAQREALSAIHEWRDAFTRIMTTLPESNTESPAALFARLAQSAPDTAQRAFVAYAQKTLMPGQKQTYFHTAEHAKQQCLQKLLPLLGSAPSRSELAEIVDRLDTGYDPFGAWMRQAQRDNAIIPRPGKRP